MTDTAPSTAAHLLVDAKQMRIGEVEAADEDETVEKC